MKVKLHIENMMFWALALIIILEQIYSEKEICLENGQLCLNHQLHHFSHYGGIALIINLQIVPNRHALISQWKQLGFIRSNKKTQPSKITYIQLQERHSCCKQYHDHWKQHTGKCQHLSFAEIWLLEQNEVIHQVRDTFEVPRHSTS